MEVQVTHNTGEHRFEAVVDGYRCELDYSLQDSTMTITHTGVPTPVGGRGIAAKLMAAALATAREQGWRVVPACSFAASFMSKNPQYDDLRGT